MSRAKPKTPDVETPEQMLVRARRYLGTSAPDVLLDVADKQINRYADLAARWDAGEHLDGRSSIYTGETYAQARDRWAAYRQLLVRAVGVPDGERR